MPSGRKIFDGKPESEVITKLEFAWSIRASDAQAALYAEISPSSLCEYLKVHPELVERKKLLKEKAPLKAKMEIVKGLDGNPDFALKYLERIEHKEYALKQKLEHTGKDGESLTPLFTKQDEGL